MAHELVPTGPTVPPALRRDLHSLPTLLLLARPELRDRFFEFFTSKLRRSKNTQLAYLRAWKKFDEFCHLRGITDLEAVKPVLVSAFLAAMEHEGYADSTVKQHLAAIRKAYDWLVESGLIEHNPAKSIAGPKIVRRVGSTPTLDDDEVLDLIESIDTSTLRGLRDRALIGVMLYTFARVSAVLRARTEDYYVEKKRWKLRLGEKGGVDHVVTLNHKAEEYLDAYLDAAGIRTERSTRQNPAYIFRAITRSGELLSKPMHRNDVLSMVKRRSKKAGIPWEKTCCHSFRATGITNYMTNGGRIDVAKVMAGHADERTTGLYDRQKDKITVEEVERIRFEREG